MLTTEEKKHHDKPMSFSQMVRELERIRFHLSESKADHTQLINKLSEIIIQMTTHRV